jgi:nicotinate-nucleotide pyrophosphorylase (carboxylating)
MTGDFDAPVHVVRLLVASALAEDLGPLGDLTAALVPADAHTTVDVVARADGVLAGTACASEVFAQLDPTVRVRWLADDGDAVGPGTKVGEVSGLLRAVLTGERSALNFLCHLSGVASLTRRFVAAAGPTARIWDTRKTLPGLRAVEKAAVRAGGGVNHRGSLSEFVLVKDNHLAGLGITEAVARARARWPGRTVEVECDRAAQVQEAIAAGATMVLLDNMTPDAVRACVSMARTTAPAGFLVEVSGGITLDTVRAYADAGADLISTSVITQSAPALDLAFDLHSATARPDTAGDGASVQKER